MEDSEKRKRIVFSLLMLPAKMANDLGFSAKDTKQWLEIALFQSYRKKGKTLKEIAQFLDIGARKTSQLSEKLRKIFLSAEHDFGIPRRIEYLVWGEPISLKRVQQLLGSEYETDEINEKRLHQIGPGDGYGKEEREI